jgi:hypothetical protein
LIVDSNLSEGQESGRVLISPKEPGAPHAREFPAFWSACRKLTSYRKRWLPCLKKRAITERKLEDGATQLTGRGVPITGFDALQVLQIVGDIAGFGDQRKISIFSRYHKNMLCVLPAFSFHRRSQITPENRQISLIYGEQ